VNDVGEAVLILFLGDPEMTQSKQSLLIPLLLITVGIGWLLSTLGFAPDIVWVWSLGLLVAGILPFMLGGLDKVSIVAGPFFLIAAGLSVLRQTGRIEFNIEVPILVIVSGILLLVARMPSIPPPKWFIPHDNES